MNCPKCNAPINDGDKFCQTCGNLVPQEEPKVEENIPVEETAQQLEPMPVAETQPVEQNPMPTQPMNNTGYAQMPMNEMNQPMNYNQPQPANQNMNYNQPMNHMNPNVSLEPKKNNTIVYVLIAFILVLLAVVVFLLVSSGKDEDKDKTNNNTNNEVTENKKEEDEDKDDEEEVITSNYTKTNVNEFTFELPEGYNAGYYGDNVVFYDENMTNVEGYVLAQNGLYDNFDKEQGKLTLMSSGLENVTYEEKKVNNKNMLIFSGEFSGYDVEVIFLEYSNTKIVGAEVYYTYGTAQTKEDVHDIVSRVTVDDSGFSSDANTRIPGLDISGLIG